MIKEPFAIDPRWTWDGVKVDEIPLYVPKGTKELYEATEGWNVFKNIVEMEDPDEVTITDVSKMVNAIYIEPANALVGNEVSLQVNLKNANTATSYGFELVLPEGLSISTMSDGSFDDAITMSTRHKGHTLTTNKLAGNTYKVAVASISSKALSDNDGLVLTIKARVADNMAVGDYPIKVQSPLIVNTDGTKPPVQDTQSKITIEDYVKGDVDGDGVVDLADAVLVINHYVGKPVATFNEKAADVDGDGGVSYITGAVFYSFHKKRYMHSVFHFFVLAGSLCHIIAVWDVLMQQL